jgi:adenosylcobinamide amidohydrolase
MKLHQGAYLEHTTNHVHIAFDRPCPVLSSAVLNGGFTEARHIVNLKVDKGFSDSTNPWQPPQVTLADYCRRCGWSGATVGMMTAASMNSFRLTRRSEQDIDIMVLLTCGLSNPRRAGDPADQQTMAPAPPRADTINTIVLTTATLTPAAMVEAVMIATEAKAAAMQNLGVTSPVSRAVATGTGTDAVAVACRPGAQPMHYCGKHVLFGEILARLVIESLHASIGTK